MSTQGHMSVFPGKRLVKIRIKRFRGNVIDVAAGTIAIQAGDPFAAFVSAIEDHSALRARQVSVMQVVEV